MLDKYRQIIKDGYKVIKHLDNGLTLRFEIFACENKFYTSIFIMNGEELINKHMHSFAQTGQAFIFIKEYFNCILNLYSSTILNLDELKFLI